MKANGQGFHPLFEKNYVGQFFTLFLDTFLKKNIFGGVGSGTLLPKISPRAWSFRSKKKFPWHALLWICHGKNRNPLFNPFLCGGSKQLKEAIYESVDVIHSKSEPTDPNGDTKQFELSANLFKNATKWPKMTQNGPKMTPGFTHFFCNFFFTEKAVPQTFSLLECMLII